MLRVSPLLLTALLLAPGLARADRPPDINKYMACEGLAVDAACQVFSFEDGDYAGTCQNLPCDSDPQMTCLTCVEEDPQGTAGEVGTAGGSSGEGTAGATTGAPTTGAPTTGDTGSSTGASTGAASDGSTTDPGTGDSKGGCSCRSADAPASGLLMLLGAVLLRRRRR